ncbi:MAG: acetyltransferase [Methylotenera sp.]|nr:MAG: acetyltransferase [Methylotenera sp.]
MSNKNRQLLIVGARGFGREVLNYIQNDNPLFTVKGFLDEKTDALDGYNRNVGVIGNPFTYQPLSNDVFMAALGDPLLRFKYTATLRDVHHVDFATVVHPQANIANHSQIKHGCVIAPRVGVSCDVRIGEFTNIQEYTVIGHDVEIGNWCQINAHCTIAGGAKIGNFVTIHPNCVITSNANIGDGVTVAAGSVVIGRIPTNITIIGNPARRFEFR